MDPLVVKQKGTIFRAQDKLSAWFTLATTSKGVVKRRLILPQLSKLQNLIESVAEDITQLDISIDSHSVSFADQSKWQCSSDLQKPWQSNCQSCKSATSRETFLQLHIQKHYMCVAAARSPKLRQQDWSQQTYGCHSVKAREVVFPIKIVCRGAAVPACSQSKLSQSQACFSQGPHRPTISEAARVGGLHGVHMESMECTPELSNQKGTELNHDSLAHQRILLRGQVHPG